MARHEQGRGMGTSAIVYILLVVYILYILGKLILWDVGSEAVDNRLAKTGWLAGSIRKEKLTQSSPKNTLCVH